MVNTEKDGKGCCTPPTDRAGAPVESTPAVVVSDDARVKALERMTRLPGGTFLMGTDFLQGFPADGEGPIHAVELDPFYIDTAPVTNALFTQFIEATEYQTEAERFGWSFVFWSHIPPRRFGALFQDQIAGASWWCRVDGASWNAPGDRGHRLRAEANTPLCM